MVLIWTFVLIRSGLKKILDFKKIIIVKNSQRLKKYSKIEAAQTFVATYLYFGSCSLTVGYVRNIT